MKLERIGKVNKLNKLFSNEGNRYKISVQFPSNSEMKKFIEAIESVKKNGEEARVNGIENWDACYAEGDSEYPLTGKNSTADIIISPVKVPIKVKTEFGESVLEFCTRRLGKETILENNKNNIFYFNLKYSVDKQTLNFYYKFQPELAETVREVVEECSKAIAFLEMLTPSEDERLSKGDESDFFDTVMTFEQFKDYFNRVLLIEEELEISFDLKNIQDEKNDEIIIHIVYILLIEKGIIKSHGKLEDAKTSEIQVESKKEELQEGTEVNLTFYDNHIYTVYGNEITLYFSNLLSNAIIKEILPEENGKITILYGDTDSKPIYVSYRGFKTSREAHLEMRKIMEHKKDYEEALTLGEYLDRRRQSLEKIKTV